MNKKAKRTSMDDYMLEILATFSTLMKPSAAGFTQAEARKPRNKLAVALNLASGGKKIRIYR